MQIYKKYSVVFNHDESEEQQVHAMACYFSNLSYYVHKGDLSGYEIEIDWCGEIKTIFTNCGEILPEYIRELYRETPCKTIDAEIVRLEDLLEKANYLNSGLADNLSSERKIIELQDQKIRNLVKELDNQNEISSDMGKIKKAILEIYNSGYEIERLDIIVRPSIPNT